MIDNGIQQQKKNLQHAMGGNVMSMGVESNNSRVLQHNKKGQREEWKRNRNEKEREKVTVRRRKRIEEL